jgi:hypothetical protein
LEQHKPIDLLPDRTAGTLATWLKARPSIAVVSRDRSGEYAAGISQGAPQAIQVADRWHLLRNLGDAIQRVLARHPKALRVAAGQASAPSTVTAPTPVEPTDVQVSAAPNPPQLTYRQLRFAEVKALAFGAVLDLTPRNNCCLLPVLNICQKLPHQSTLHHYR